MKKAVLFAGIAAAMAACLAGASPAPDFRLESLEGRAVRLSDYRGKAVLLNFWATWCAPCRVEMPWLADLSWRYRPQGLEVVGVSMDGGAGRSKITSFVRERNIPYTILLGDETVAAAYGGIRYLPQTFFIGRDGGLARSISGLAEKSDLERSVLTLLAPKDGRQRAGAARDKFAAAPSPVQPLPSYSM